MGECIGRTVALALFGITLAGCSKLLPHETPEAGELPPVASPASTPAAPPTERVANESAVKRYGDEKPLDQIPANLEAAFTDPRTEAGLGEVVVTLARGTSVRPVAQKGAFVLIQFADPKDATRTLAGWIQQTALKQQAVRPRAVASTAASASASPIVSASAAPSAAPAPSATPTPAASASSAPTTPPKAGTKPIKIAMAGGKCAAGYTMYAGTYCRLACNVDIECAATAGSKCSQKMCFGPQDKP